MTRKGTAKAPRSDPKTTEQATDPKAASTQGTEKVPRTDPKATEKAGDPKATSTQGTEKASVARNPSLSRNGHATAHDYRTVGLSRTISQELVALCAKRFDCVAT